MLVSLLFADLAPMPVLYLYTLGGPIIGGVLLVYAAILVGRTMRRKNQQSREEKESQD